MLGMTADSLGMGGLHFVGGGAYDATQAPGPATGDGLGGSAALAWGVLLALLIAGYLFFNPITA